MFLWALMPGSNKWTGWDWIGLETRKEAFSLTGDFLIRQYLAFFARFFVGKICYSFRATIYTGRCGCQLQRFYATRPLILQFSSGHTAYCYRYAELAVSTVALAQPPLCRPTVLYSYSGQLRQQFSSVQFSRTHTRAAPRINDVYRRRRVNSPNGAGRQ